MTNREMLEAMSNEELAEYMFKKHVACRLCSYNNEINCIGYSCIEGHQKWLESEAEEDD